MPIEFACDNCGQRFRRDDEDAGKKGKCPCGELVVVPLSTTNVPLAVTPFDTPPAVPVSAAAIAAAEDQDERRGSWKLVAGAALSIAVAGGALFALLPSPEQPQNPLAATINDANGGNAAARPATLEHARIEASAPSASATVLTRETAPAVQSGLGYTLAQHKSKIANINQQMGGIWRVLSDTKRDDGTCVFQVIDTTNSTRLWIVSGPPDDLSSVSMTYGVKSDANNGDVVIVAAGTIAGLADAIPGDIKEWGDDFVHWWGYAAKQQEGHKVAYAGRTLTLVKVGTNEGALLVTEVSAGAEAGVIEWGDWIAEHPIKTAEAQGQWLPVDGAKYNYRSMTYRTSGRYCRVSGEIRNDTGKSDQLTNFDVRLLDEHGRFLGGSGALVTNFKDGQTRTFSASVECDGQPSVIEIAFASAL